ncbi:DUF2157 domain-containing protein [Sneathiella marina]|uniref:DUF2157 domain-containing protein n=1 Tax=Sneathiella marina TaxID=2950108 RepID=A0ABY4W6J4_9PROT|nr:DUF2157 domain-containing protein [Sneathiella marina]USG62658.1 DUF2157 domain-containing protein [Sneathiella marina]
MDKAEARLRVRQIASFRSELAELEKSDILRLTDEKAETIGKFHAQILNDIAEEFDTDLSDTEAQLSWGMKLASTCGAVALSMAIFMFFNYYWDNFSTGLQVSLAVIAPFLAWGVTELVAKLYRVSYFTSLAVLVAIACFVIDIYIVGEIYNLSPSPTPFLAWGLFGLLLAFRHDLSFVLALSVASLLVFAGGILTTLLGYSWSFSIVPEVYLPGCFVILATPFLFPHGLVREQRSTFLLVGMLGIYGILMSLLFMPYKSLLPLPVSSIEWVYTVISLILSCALTWACLRAKWTVGSYISAGFLILYILQRYCDWFWKIWPSYLFFLVLGLFAIFAILILRRVRFSERRRQREIS